MIRRDWRKDWRKTDLQTTAHEIIKIPRLLLCPASYFAPPLILAAQVCKWHTWQAWIIINTQRALMCALQINGFPRIDSTQPACMKGAQPGSWIYKGDSKLFQRTITAHSVYLLLYTDVHFLNLSKRWNTFWSENRLQCRWAALYLPFPFASCCGLSAFATINLSGM